MVRRTILFLHGGHQNAAVFEKKTAPLRAQLERNGFVVQYLQGAIEVDGPEVEDAERRRMWWRISDTDLFGNCVDADGVANAVKHALQEIANIEEVVGVFGFSMGGRMAVALAPHLPNVSALVLASSFHNDDPAVCDALSKVAAIPSLHVYGTADDLIPQQLFQRFVDGFQNGRCLLHSKAHVINNNSEIRRAVTQFFAENWGLRHYTRHFGNSTP